MAQAPIYYGAKLVAMESSRMAFHYYYFQGVISCNFLIVHYIKKLRPNYFAQLGGGFYITPMGQITT